TMNMHADENSDGVIVPEKRPNKEGLPSAEAVEGRTPPKGNGDETAAARTLRRDNASNGLIAVRQAARQSKSVRFTALLHHITVDLVKRSYLSLDGDSDGVIVPEKRPNKEGLPSAEAVEGRTPPKGNGDETAAARTLRRDNASNGLIAVRQAARQSKSVRFTALLHHITVDLLKRSYLSLERDSAPGIDGVTWQSYGENLEEKLEDLHDKVHRGSYRARPARRTYIPKADGSKRPLSILCLEDKIVQQAVATVLEAIYEEDFLGFSYGFRPGRGQHDALDALHAGILRKQVSWCLARN